MAPLSTDSVDLDETPSATAHEMVYRILRARILEGALAPGTALTLRGVAEALGVSMTPAREAVRRLVAERALALTETGRVAVPIPGGEDLDALFTARALLEPELARRAAGRIEPEQLDRLRALDAEIGPAIERGDAGAYVSANTRFHSVLYAAAEAPALLALVESVWLQTAPSMRRVYAELGDQATDVLADFHLEALQALAEADTDALCAAIRADVLQGAALLRRTISGG
ncbi:MAG: GntR family transcriptional regulator [Pseudomonadota bacterium]